MTLVAQIITINQQATNVVYLLDDGTGRIEARHWLVPNDIQDAEKWSGLSYVSSMALLSSLSDIPIAKMHTVV